MLLQNSKQVCISGAISGFKFVPVQCRDVKCAATVLAVGAIVVDLLLFSGRLASKVPRSVVSFVLLATHTKAADVQVVPGSAFMCSRCAFFP